MQIVARTLRYFANRYLADPRRPNQQTARTNAAEASATLRKRSRERAEVDAYLCAQRRADRGADKSRASQGGGLENTP